MRSNPLKDSKTVNITKMQKFHKRKLDFKYVKEKYRQKATETRSFIKENKIFRII